MRFTTPRSRWVLPLLAISALPSSNALTATESNSTLTLANDRIKFVLDKATARISTVDLDGLNLLGTPVSSSSAIGPYVDSYAVTPKGGNYVPGKTATYKLVTGTDSAGIPYGGMIMSQAEPDGVVGEVFEQYWFLRGDETSLHAFTHIAYHNSSVPFLVGMLELRTLFRPHGPLFTHLSSSAEFNVPQPQPNPAVDATFDLGVATLVQDTTWYLGNRTNDPFVEQVGDYFTKYTLSEVYRDHKVHGLFADGTASPDNSTYGAWMVYNSKDTFFGGPTYSDLVIDGLLYNYMVSNHHGNQAPNITDGFDRTWGPSIYHFNKGSPGGSIDELRTDAEKYADIGKAAKFYDDIAHHVPGYVPSSGRGSWKAKIKLPKDSKNPIAILSAPGFDYQDNAQNPAAYQYWADVGADGNVEIPRVVAGDYRLTVYADGIFGDFVYEKITVKANKETNSKTLQWKAESAGKELWRIGTPDKSAGEFRHGDHPDPNHPLHPPEYRMYWGTYDFIDDFPNGINFHVGKSDEATDFNYVHWSVFGGTLTRPEVVAASTINNWTVTFDVDKSKLKGTKQATLTIQFAGVTTAAGNTDVYSPTAQYSNLPYVVVVNGHELEPLILPYYNSGSCASRSGITCYQNRNKFVFPSSYLSYQEENQIVLSLPFNGTGSGVMSGVSVMYDALRLEVK